MASNPNVNKVVYGNQTVMDITDTTATEGDVANGAVFYKANGARSVGTATPSDPEWGDITGTLSDQTDLQTILDTKQNTLTFDNVPTSGSNNPVKSGGVYSKQVHEITRTGVTVSADGTVRIPAPSSGSDSRITTSSTVIPITTAKPDGTPYKYKACNVYEGYAVITMAEAISNIEVGIWVLNQ